MTSDSERAGRAGEPLLSVVVPAYRRPHTVSRMLEALSRQTFPPTQFEVVVVVDGPYEPLEEVLRTAATPYALRWFVRPHRGETAQRNFGLAAAQAPVVLYLDDDVIPSPELLARHHAHFDGAERIAVFGALRPDPDSTEPLVGKASDWTTAHFQRCAAALEPSHTDLPDNNFSIRKQELEAIGGWDEGLCDGYGGIDDRELGYRLRQAGVRFRFDAEAQAFHCWAKPLRDELEHCRIEGRGQLYFYAKFPDALSHLSVVNYLRGAWWQRAVLLLARWTPPPVCRLAVAVAPGFVRLLGRAHESSAVYTIKALRHWFLCRGFWDRRDLMKKLLWDAKHPVASVPLQAGKGNP